jgi:proline dehydrogenase
LTHAASNGGRGCHPEAIFIDRPLLFQLATSSRFEHAVRALPYGDRLAWHAASRYVSGRTARDALALALELHQRGIGVSIDQFGESVREGGVAEIVAADYVRLAEKLAELPDDTWLSIDLSHLGLDIDQRRCAEHLAAIARRLPPGRRIQVGAEDYARSDAVMGCVLAVGSEGLATRLGATVQANLHRATGDLDRLLECGIHVRLVKGAYLESPTRALPYGEATDVAYLRLAHRAAQAGGQFSLATHDGVLREALLASIGARPVEQLLGVRPSVLCDLVTRGIPIRVYIPFGDQWFRYWMRRLAESRGR